MRNQLYTCACIISFMCLYSSTRQALHSFAFLSEKIVCYYGTWATYRHGNGQFNVNDIDPNVCTHLIYSFFGLTRDATVRILDPYLDLSENYGRGNIEKFISLKQQNPKLKTMAAIGGWNEGSATFSAVKAITANRRKLKSFTLCCSISRSLPVTPHG